MVFHFLILTSIPLLFLAFSVSGEISISVLYLKYASGTSFDFTIFPVIFSPINFAVASAYFMENVFGSSSWSI